MMPPPAILVPSEMVPSPPCVVEVATTETRGACQESSVDDYLVGDIAMFDAQTGLPPAGEGSIGV
jgi:hypothetical protein